MTNIFITMTLIAAAFRDVSANPETIRAKNLALTAATMTYSLKQLSFCRPALQQLKHWQRWASKANFQLQKCVISSKIFWHPGVPQEPGDTFPAIS